MAIQVHRPVSPRTTSQWKLVLTHPTSGIMRDFMVQQVTTPRDKILNEGLGQPGVPYNTFHPVGIEWDNLTLKGVMNMDEDDQWDWNAITAAVDPVTGRIGLSNEIKFRFTVQMLDNNADPIQQRVYEGMVIEAQIDELNATNKAILMREIVVKVDRRIS